MTPSVFLRDIVEPRLKLLEDIYDVPASDEARVMMLAIALQETGLRHRRQVGDKGVLPHLARGWWQFEKGGGVDGVLRHHRSRDAAQYVCSLLMIDADQATVHEAIAWNDQLSSAFARLLLWTDEKPLPELGDEQGAWDCYVRNWRPGKPHRDAWKKHYATALACVRARPAEPEPQPVEQTPLPAPATVGPAPAPVATATVVVPQVQPETKDDRFVTAPGKWSSEFYVTAAYLAVEFIVQAIEVWNTEDIDTSGGWIAVAAYVASRTLVKMAAAIGKTPTVVVAKK